MDMLDHETMASFGGFLSPLKQQCHYLQHNKKSTSQDDMHFVPDHDILDPSSWAELQPPSGLNMEGKFMMDGKFSMDSKFSKQMWQQPDITCWMPSEPADGVTPSIPEGRENDSTNLDSLVGGVLDQHQSQQQNLSTSFHDEDIQSWLQYPLDDAAPDSNYCLESWGELPPSSPVNREPLGNGNVTVSRQGFSGKPNGGNNIGSIMGINSLQSGLRGSNAEEAMDLAAKRASGMIPVSGAETFNKVRSTSMPTITTSNVKWIPSVNGKVSGPSSCPPSGLESWHRGKVSHLDNGTAGLLKETASVQPSGLASEVMMAPPPATSNRTAPINFAHFSRPAAIYRNLQSMEAGVCGVINSSLKAVGNKTRSLSTTSSSVAESTIMTASGVHGVKLVDSPSSITYFPGSGRIQDQDTGRGRGGDIGNRVGSIVETDSPGIRKMMKSASAGVPMKKNPLQKNASLPVKLGDDQLDVGNVSTISRVLGNGNADQGMALHSKQSLEATSCYDGESYERVDKDGIAAWNKRKRSREEDTEYGTSDDAVEESVDTKKQGRGGTATGTTSSAKRTRAAEVHNLSERKRRDRINERMKALQDLIPNSNKTDKASMLDEAIEYLKMLQVQLQMMAMRAGMPQMVPGQQFGQMPMGGLNGMPMPQMPQMSQMGMGGVGAMQMGMGMGMGMGMSTGMAPLGNFGMSMGMGSVGGPAMGVGMGVSDLPNMPHSLPHTMGQGMSKSLPKGLPFSPPQRQRQEGSCVQSTSSSGQMPSQSGGMSESAFPRQLAPSTVDPLGAYLSRQQQRQSHQPVNLELYQTFMLQQHQQH